MAGPKKQEHDQLVSAEYKSVSEELEQATFGRKDVSSSKQDEKYLGVKKTFEVS
jgi:hypothetical protein